MDVEIHRRATVIFLEACEREGEERTRFVSDSCGADEQLRRAVEGLIEADSASAGFLERSPTQALLEAEGRLPGRVGPFRVVALLGRGAMGEVYEAEQETPRRRVAVKVLRAEFFTRDLLARFRYEAELLGRLQHKGIAQVFAAGTEEGAGGARPWIAMELVRGTSVDRFTAEGLLGVAATLELVARIADAVHHAHQRGVVHRDLKSANVLVDESGEPKVLDFGVARASGADMRATLATQPGMVIGTLATMSPEQAAALDDIDARTDVYSLGAIAYELLAGRPPLELGGLAVHQALLRIAQEEPPRLGTLRRELAGDVEVVVAKALEKDRERRYASAAAFADDLRRVVRGEPVEARPPSTAYLVSKLVRRHRGLSAALLATLLAVIGGLAAFGLQSKATARAEKLAREETETAAQIQRYVLEELIAAPDPRVQGRDIRVVDVLERAADGAPTAFADRPHVLAAVQLSLSRSLRLLGDLERAESLARAAAAGYAALRGRGHPEELDARGSLIATMTERGLTAESLPLAREFFADCRERLGEEHTQTVAAKSYLGALLMIGGEAAEAEALLGEVWQSRVESAGANDPQTLAALGSFADAVWMSGGFEEATALRREYAQGLRETLGDQHLDTLEARLAVLRDFQTMNGRNTGSSQEGTEILEGLESYWGERHSRVLGARLALAQALEGEKRRDEALVVFEGSHEIALEQLGRGHSEVVESQLMLASALVRRNLLNEAVDLGRDALAQLEANPLPEPNLVVGARTFLGGVLCRSGEVEGGIEQLDMAIEMLAGRSDAVAEGLRGRAQRERDRWAAPR
jgi:eukaryotic-like serine/threonine-protein kinase